MERHDDNHDSSSIAEQRDWVHSQRTVRKIQESSSPKSIPKQFYSLEEDHDGARIVMLDTPPLLYFAGKVASWELGDTGYTCNDYRHILAGFEVMEEDEEVGIIQSKCGSYFRYGGPFRFSNRHGGDKEDCFNNCLEQIRNCDGVLAYIESNDCYGTLFEIGFAYALGKKIEFVFKEGVDPKKEMWFAEKSDRDIYDLRERRVSSYPLIPPKLSCFATRKEWYSKAYLQSDHWATERKCALERYDKRCALCNVSYGLQVHHRTYERLGHEAENDLIVLCRNCHSKHHNKGEWE